MAGVAEEDGFDPRGLLAALHRNYVSYVLIGGLARVIRGTDEVTSGVDICPSLRCREPGAAGGGARRAGGEARGPAAAVGRRGVASRTSGCLRLRTSMGELNVVAEPAGTRRGFDDLRRGATEEHIGAGLRPRVASVADLARMSAALAHELGREPGREAERLRQLAVERSRELRRIMEVEVGMERTLGIARDIGIDM